MGNQCFRCGKPRHENMATCKATNATCNKCKTRGHYDSVCGAAKGAIPKTTRHTTNYTSCNTSTVTGTTPIINLKFESEKKQEFSIPVILDTGSSMTIFSKSILEKHKIALRDATEELYNASGSRMTVNGKVKLSATFRDKTVKIEALVSEDIKDDKVL